MKIFKYSIVLSLALSTGNIIGQLDRHYTMFYGNAVSYNPAAAGMFNGDGRAFSSYRNQWSSVTANPYRTINFSVDGKVLKKQIENGILGLGFTYYNDKAGDGRLTNTNFGLSLSYGVELSKDMHLSAGLQAGLGQNKISFDNFTWSNQWVGNGYDQAVNNLEPFYEEINTFFDMAGGIYLYGSVGDYIDLKGGIAVNHITAQDVSFINVSDRIYRNYSISLFPEIRIPYKRIAFVPGVFAFMQGPNKELMIGTDIKYYIKESSHFTGYFDETSMSLGMFTRIGDAVVFTGAFNHAGLSLGIGYDVNYSSLKVATGGFGAYEIFLRYRLGYGYQYSVGGKGRF